MDNEKDREVPFDWGAAPEPRPTDAASATRRRGGRIPVVLAAVGVTGLIAAGAVLALDLADGSADQVAFAAAEADADTGTGEAVVAASPDYLETVRAVLWAAEHEGFKAPESVLYISSASPTDVAPSAGSAAAPVPSARCTMAHDADSPIITCLETTDGVGAEVSGAESGEETPVLVPTGESPATAPGEEPSAPLPSAKPSTDAGAETPVLVPADPEAQGGNLSDRTVTFTMTVLSPGEIPSDAKPADSELARAMAAAQQASTCKGVAAGITATEIGTPPVVWVQCPDGTYENVTLKADMTVEKVEDVPTLPDGSYVVKLRGDGSTVTVKVG